MRSPSLIVTLWAVAVALSSVAIIAFHAGEHYAQARAEAEACVDTCEGDDDGPPELCSDLCSSAILEI